jgi:hypothetical protein
LFLESIGLESIRLLLGWCHLDLHCLLLGARS